ncbi:MAG TPA: hypothetical protein VKK31_28805 [Thermoanaerobaculia bacterium]|nr:hypothetical protein [Thermoanaerobaculia bacterium]
MATTTIRRFGVLSVGKIMGMLYALIGLIAGAIFALLSLVGLGIGSALSQDTQGAFPAALFGVGAIIILPLFYGCIGFVGGIISSAIYNLVSGMTGGIEVELSAPVTSGVPIGAPSYGQA